MLPDEARAAATAEGLELVPSSSKTGFKGVHKTGGQKYYASITENGAALYLGTFSTPEEAALCYARHIGAERAATEAAQARGEGPQSLTANEARAAAAAEGLELVPSSSNETGFRGVYNNGGNKYRVRIRENGKARYLGNFTTPEEASLTLARYNRIWAEELQRLTGDETSTATAAEGFDLVPFSSKEKDFKGVSKNCGNYKVQVSENGKLRHLGTFSTPEEAALCYVRHIGAERVAAEALEARVAVPEPLTADEAKAAAAVEGFEMVPASSKETDFKGVTNPYGRFTTQIWESGKMGYLGNLSMPEKATLSYATHIGAERVAAEVAEARGEGPQPLTADEARAAAAAEGLELVLSSSNETYEHPLRLEAWPAPARSSSTKRERNSDGNCSGLHTFLPIGKRQAIREFNEWLQATAAVGGVVLQGCGAHDWWQARGANQEEWQDAPGARRRLPPQPRQHVHFHPLEVIHR